MITDHDKPYVLRLTIGALCEISNKLGTDGPNVLADKLRRLSADQESMDTVHLILECLLRPTLSPPCSCGAADIFSPVLGDENSSQYLSAIVTVFENSFAKIPTNPSGNSGRDTENIKEKPSTKQDEDHGESGQWQFLNWLRIAVVQMKLSPSEFWNMPIAEWLSLIQPACPQGMPRKNLEELKKQYPDTLLKTESRQP